MSAPAKILIFQTAFIGDVVLTLPLAQTLRRSFPAAQIDFVAVPSAAEVLRNHPAINRVIVYDKRGAHKGPGAMMRFARRLRKERYEVAIVPHRSIRSALVVWMARIPVRVGFSTSAGRWLLTHKVIYHAEHHEIIRNLDLLGALDIAVDNDELPLLYPNEADRNTVTMLLNTWKAGASDVRLDELVALAPGSVWATKRWPKEKFEELGRSLAAHGTPFLLVGGKGDEALGAELAEAVGERWALNTAGKLTLLESAELIRRCRALVSNDSAPMHLAIAVGTPVIALFGATVPRFGFGPRGPHDVVVQIEGLPCRPCSIHGGQRCPIGTFVCMNRIAPDDVLRRVHEAVSSSRE